MRSCAMRLRRCSISSRPGCATWRTGTVRRPISRPSNRARTACAAGASCWRWSASSRAGNRSCSTRCSARSRAKNALARVASRVCSPPTSTRRPPRSPSSPTRMRNWRPRSTRAVAKNASRSIDSRASSPWPRKRSCTTPPARAPARPRSFASTCAPRFLRTGSWWPTRPASPRSTRRIVAQRSPICPVPTRCST